MVSKHQWIEASLTPAVDNSMPMPPPSYEQCSELGYHPFVKPGKKATGLVLFSNDINLLNPPAELEKRKHKLKRLVQSPYSFFMDVKYQG
ncbi:hypothetical protein MKX01_041912 [Papaver californicum]|nr:hypothetical protein MKX01_041912 [Papaver californicum]